MVSTNYDPCDLAIRLIDKDNNVKEKFYSFYELFRVRLPSLATPYETFKEDGKELRGLSFRCGKEVMELLLEYAYTDTIDFAKWSYQQIFDCISFCISHRSNRPTAVLIRYLISSTNRANVCFIAEKAYELKLFTADYSGEIKELCHNFFMLSLKFIVNFWELVSVSRLHIME